MTEPNIFNQYLNKRKDLVRYKKYLQTDYIPESLPHRDDLLNQLVEIIAPSLNKIKPSNILIIGQTGTGKTVTVNFLGKELKKADSAEENVSLIYINCEITDTPYGILYNIANTIITDSSKKVPYTGWSVDKIIEELKNYMEEQKKIFIVVLDEIDRSINKNGDDVFYYLTSINNSLKESKISVIGISNNPKFTDLLSSKIKSRLCEEKIIFPPYSVEEINDILLERANNAFDEGILDVGVIPYCAAITAQDGGDARRAISLLKLSAEIAERNGDPVITEAHVKSAKNKFEMDAVTEIVKKALNDQLKIVLMSIIKITEKGQKTMITGEVYSSYKDICEIIGYSSLTQRRVADMISELDMLGLIYARVKSYGRNGRTKEIELNLSRDIVDLLKEDELFKDLVNYKPPKQTTLI
ncbi:orc1/cdc6 family replication initiation protein [Methanomassiliicoccales archaeon LGM-RCC1]|nr:orc1/cdc6 family replication initiation protein [Methanomassiliicoccales archaeon LGM-RCC1]